MVSSVAPRPREKVNFGGLPVLVKQPSATTTPLMKSASRSVAGRTVVVLAAQASTAHRLVTSDH